MPVSTPLYKPNLENAQQAFDHWRATRTSRSRTPISLQHRAAALLSSHPASHICRALKINDKALKRWWRATTSSSAPLAVDSTPFVELPAERQADINADALCRPSGTVSIELGEAIKIRLQGEFTLEQILQAARSHQQGVRG